MKSLIQSDCFTFWSQVVTKYDIIKATFVDVHFFLRVQETLKLRISEIRFLAYIEELVLLM